MCFPVEILGNPVVLIMRFIRPSLSILIIGFWGIMMGLLVKKEFFPRDILKRINLLEIPKRWGIYMETDRVGFFDIKIGETRIDFNLSLIYDDMCINLVGGYENNLLNVKTQIGDFRKEYTLPLNKTVLFSDNLPVKMQLKRVSFIYNKAELVPVRVVDVCYRDMKIECWMDNHSIPLKVVTPWGWELRAE